MMDEATSALLQLMRAEEYLDQQCHFANIEEASSGDAGLVEWYEDGYEFLTSFVDNVPMGIVE